MVRNRTEERTARCDIYNLLLHGGSGSSPNGARLRLPPPLPGRLAPPRIRVRDESEQKSAGIRGDGVRLRLADVEKIIATTEARIEDQRRRTWAMAMATDFEASMKGSCGTGRHHDCSREAEIVLGSAAGKQGGTGTLRDLLALPSMATAHERCCTLASGVIQDRWRDQRQTSSAACLRASSDRYRPGRLSRANFLQT